MARKRNHGRVSFNPVVAEKHLENGQSEEEVEVGEEEEEVVKELEMETSADEHEEEEETPTLTEQEAKLMAGKFQKMSIAKDTGFKKGDIILVRPDGVPKKTTDPELLWKAKVMQARKDKGGKIYLRIQWYYSAEQTSALPLSAKTKFRPQDVCGKHELVETNHEDVVSREDFVAPLEVQRLTDSPEQDEIEDGDWYMRASYNIKSKAFTKITSCPLCAAYYRPESGKTKDEQAFCPHCHKWYHHVCLDSKGRHLSQDDCEEDLTKRLARNIAESTTEPPAKRARKGAGPKSATSPNRRGSQTAEIRAQRDLRRIAGTRIVRGAGFGITGTVKQIYTARKILSELDAGITSRLTGTNWKDEVGSRLVEDSKDWPESTGFCYTCPRCENAI